MNTVVVRNQSQMNKLIDSKSVSELENIHLIIDAYLENLPENVSHCKVDIFGNSFIDHISGNIKINTKAAKVTTTMNF